MVQAYPDILAVMQKMPEMDGYMLLRHIRSLPLEQGGQIPAIALTAYAGEGDRASALEAGFQHHISKPLEPDNLIQVVLRVLNNSQSL